MSRRRARRIFREWLNYDYQYRDVPRRRVLTPMRLSRAGRRLSDADQFRMFTEIFRGGVWLLRRLITSLVSG